MESGEGGALRQGISRSGVNAEHALAFTIREILNEASIVGRDLNLSEPIGWVSTTMDSRNSVPVAQTTSDTHAALQCLPPSY